MDFKSALKLMKEGNRCKLPSWGGYWYWDEDRETVMMHTKDGEILDIRETKVVEYTLLNVCSDEWLLVDESNTPVLGGMNRFGFGEALKYVLRGFRLSRDGWNGKDQFVCLIPHSNNKFKGYPMQDCLGLKTVGEEMQPGWVPSIRDLLADDWYFVD